MARTGRPPDPDARGVYTAEDRLERWLELGTVTVFGSPWVLEPEVRFAQVTDVQRYVDRLSAHLVAAGWGAIPAVRVRRRAGLTKATYEAGPPASAAARTRGGDNRGVDNRGGTIALPDRVAGDARSGWALREALVLHEFAHHLVHHGVHHGIHHGVHHGAHPGTPVDERGLGTRGGAAGSSGQDGGHDPAHGPRFRRTLLALFDEAGHPTAAALLRIAFAEEGLT